LARKVKYPFSPIPNALLGTDKFSPDEALVKDAILRMSIGFNGCMKTHPTTFKQISDMKGLSQKRVAKACRNLKELGLIDFDKIKRGGKFVIRIKNLIPEGFYDNYLKDSKSNTDIDNVDNDINNVDNDINNVQIEHNPPLTKEILKETSKDTFKEEEFDFNRFRDNWFSANENNEELRKMLSLRFDLNKVQDIFNQLSNTQKKEVCLGTKRFVQYLQNNPNESQWIKNASNFILKEDYKPHFKAINDEIREENRRLERMAYLEEAERNKATNEEVQEILSNWKNERLKNGKR